MDRFCWRTGTLNQMKIAALYILSYKHFTRVIVIVNAQSNSNEQGIGQIDRVREGMTLSPFVTDWRNCSFKNTSS